MFYNLTPVVEGSNRWCSQVGITSFMVFFVLTTVTKLHSSINTIANTCFDFSRSFNCGFNLKYPAGKGNEEDIKRSRESVRNL